MHVHLCTCMYLLYLNFSFPAAVGVISETIRKVTMARSLKNVKTAQIVTLTATHRAITLMDPTAKRSIGQVHVQNVHVCITFICQ